MLFGIYTPDVSGLYILDYPEGNFGKKIGRARKGLGWEK